MTGTHDLGRELAAAGRRRGRQTSHEVPPGSPSASRVLQRRPPSLMSSAITSWSVRSTRRSTGSWTSARTNDRRWHFAPRR